MSVCSTLSVISNSSRNSNAVYPKWRKARWTRQPRVICNSRAWFGMTGSYQKLQCYKETRYVQNPGTLFPCLDNLSRGKSAMRSLFRLATMRLHRQFDFSDNAQQRNRSGQLSSCECYGASGCTMVGVIFVMCSAFAMTPREPISLLAHPTGKWRSTLRTVSTSSPSPLRKAWRRATAFPPWVGSVPLNPAR